MNNIVLTGIIKVLRETMPFRLVGSTADGVCLTHENPIFIGRQITTSEVVSEKELNSKTKLIRTQNSVYLIICD